MRGAALHDPVFDDVAIHRPWGEFETASLRAFFDAHLAEGAYVMSTIDLEAYWLAHHFPQSRRVLSPGAHVFPHLAKPPSPVPDLAHLGEPATVQVPEGTRACHAFLRATGFNAWLKGPFHDALHVRSWERFDATWNSLAQYWPGEGTHLQAHVDGAHEAIAFAAHGGQLLDAVWIVKNDMTTDGKTVGATRRRMADRDWRALRDYAAELDWHGGGEIELVRDRHDRPWLIEINARFPAWIAGARFLGTNLPATLLAAELGVALDDPPVHEGFVRVQHEVPTRPGYRLLEPIVLEPGEPLDAAKTAFSIHELASHLRQTIGLPLPERVRPAQHARDADGPIPDGIAATLGDPGLTPRHWLDTAGLARRCAALAERRARWPGPPWLDVAYSMKTNPDPRVLAQVRDAGLSIETIGAAEYDRARTLSFPAERIVVNGPAKPDQLLADAGAAGATVFCDSLDEMRRLTPAGMRRRLLGVRLCPPEMASRFGVPMGDPDTVTDLLRVIGELSPAELGVHMHIAHAAVGWRTWRSLVETVAEFAAAVAEETDVPLTVMDVGGGMYPDALAAELDWLAGTLCPKLAREAPGLRRVIVEPGRAMVQDTAAVIATVLETRARGGARELVLDAALAEVSEAGHYPHRLAALDARGAAYSLGPGRDRLLGRSCMEDDVLARHVDTSGLRAGDRVAILDAGSYDWSMAYDFGRGRATPA